MPAEDNTDRASRIPADDASPFTHTVMAGRAQHVPIQTSAGELHVTIRWPGDGVVDLRLTRPDGHVVLPDEEGVEHEHGATFESYHISHPQEGEWQATLRSQHTPAAGIPVTLQIHQAEEPGDPGSVTLKQEVSGRVVVVSVATSFRPIAYLWEFGDGAVSRHGPTARHRYREAGRYRVSVAVQTRDGQWRVATVDEVVDIR